MEIVFDNIVFSLQKVGGISIVWQNLLDGAKKFSNIDYQCIEYSGASDNLFRKMIEIPRERLIILSNKFILIKRYFSPNIYYKTPFIFHSSYYRYCKSKNAINFTTIHDFTYEYYYSGLRKLLHCHQKYKAIKHSDYIICISETTKNDLLKFYPKIDESKVHVVYNGVSSDYFPIEHCDNSMQEYGNYIVFVGSRKGYKNFDIAVKAIKESHLNLVIIGNKLTIHEKEMLISEIGINRFFEFGRISNNELNKVYNAAFCLLYPSLYEGFGIPVLEAQKAGCPVITVNTPSIVEIIGDKTLVAKNNDIKSIIDKIRLIKDSTLRKKIIELGYENVKKYSWEKMQDKIFALYKAAIKSKNENFNNYSRIQ